MGIEWFDLVLFSFDGLFSSGHTCSELKLIELVLSPLLYVKMRVCPCNNFTQCKGTV